MCLAELKKEPCVLDQLAMLNTPIHSSLPPFVSPTNVVLGHRMYPPTIPLYSCRCTRVWGVWVLLKGMGGVFAMLPRVSLFSLSYDSAVIDILYYKRLMPLSLSLIFRLSSSITSIYTCFFYKILHIII